MADYLILEGIALGNAPAVAELVRDGLFRYCSPVFRGLSPRRRPLRFKHRDVIAGGVKMRLVNYPLSCGS